MFMWIFIIFSVGIAAIVGGVTNHFALKMLFYPRKAVHVGRWRIPFTPGLIPRRKADIAASFGEVVAEYLVTCDGLRVMLGKREVSEQVVQTIERIVQKWMHDETTVKGWVARLFSNEAWDEVRDRFAHQLDEWLTDALRQWLTEKGWHEKPVVEWLSEDWRLSSEKWINHVVSMLLALFKEELTSLQGQLFIKRMTKGLLSRTSGFLGTVASIFVDEDKLAARITPMLVEQLGSAALHATLVSFLVTKRDEWLQETPAQLVRTWAGLSEDSDSLEYALHLAREWVQWRRRLEVLANVQPSRLAGQYKSVWMPYVPRAVHVAIVFLDRHLDVIVRAARLQEVVRTQVEQFPITKLETIILHVSGKEFRAITWLGALLGGIIGFMQALLLLVIR